MRTEVVVNKRLLQAILQSAKAVYPRETVLLLRGKAKKETIEVTDFIIPPLASHGRGFSSFPAHMLPIDFSVVGSVHSHPSGVKLPSVEDLNRSFGKIMMIVAYPFEGEDNVAVYSSSGEKIVLKIAK
ncbi:MAG: Mov34/MPN/PAD-1 family protein [Candidatus Bathyarchaeota archaeon]|nr:MAG: Mov34/MPN/PAD-1 family protein [Candidatus Bathyarchaeota archaeon]